MPLNQNMDVMVTRNFGYFYAGLTTVPSALRETLTNFYFFYLNNKQIKIFLETSNRKLFSHFNQLLCITYSKNVKWLHSVSLVLSRPLVSIAYALFTTSSFTSTFDSTFRSLNKFQNFSLRIA